MGIVYRARDKRLKRLVAIKLLPPELAFRRDIRSRFLREAETAAQLSHPNIVPIYSVDEVGNLVFFVMACIEGDNLARQVQKRGPLPVDEVRRWLTEVADALAYAHARGVVHRDIKPDNILVDAVDGRALVTDFGIARAAIDSGDASRLTATGMAIGTPTYMSPEQASGDRDIDGRTDLYALGVVAYQMLTGEPPFVGNSTPALLIKHLTEAPVPVSVRRPDVSSDLEAIVMRLLEKNPDHRFQTSAELAQSLRTGVLPPAPGGSTPRFDGSTVGGMTLPPSTAPRGLATLDVSMTVAGNEDYQPSAMEMQRWDAPLVADFRRKLATYLFVNGALVVVSIFTGGELLSITTFWTIYIAFKYAKLWSEGFDWKDVLRQPRDRMFGEVVSDAGDSFISVFSSKKREELRAQGRQSRLRGALSNRPSTNSMFPRGGGGSPPAQSGFGVNVSTNRPSSAAGMPPMVPVRIDQLGPYAQLVQRAREDRDEITRLLNTMPAEERKLMPDVAKSALTLVGKMEQISASLASDERELQQRPVDDIDKEIAKLEGEANPLDTQGSEARVRRLAQLRRERRAATEAVKRLESRKAQLESCRLALENVRLDLVRLRTGNSSVQSVTLIAEQAMALAHDVDIAVAAAREVRDATRMKTSA
jgi:serine/threonine-protein kinase